LYSLLLIAISAFDCISAPACTMISACRLFTSDAVNFTISPTFSLLCTDGQFSTAVPTAIQNSGTVSKQGAQAMGAMGRLPIANGQTAFKKTIIISKMG
jgi:hypothetical protein